MGNYSYLLKVLNCKNTKINWNNFKDGLFEIMKDVDNYFYFDNEDTFDNIVSLEDLANHLHDKKLFGYLTNPTCQILCKICLNTEFTDSDNLELPIMYFEEEGWDRIHYLKFNIGSEDIEWCSYAFDFDNEHYENKIKEEISNKKTRCIDKIKTIVNKGIDDIWELVDKKRNEYVYNLIYDRATNWKKHCFSYNQPKQDYKNLDTISMLALFGLRYEDCETKPNYIKEQMEKLNALRNI